MLGNADPDPVAMFEEALARARAGLEEIESPSLRARREEALAHLATYVELLQEATQFASERGRRQSASSPGYWLKLEFADGRWTVAYRALTEPPQVGAVIELEPESRWLVQRVQRLKPAPPRAPVRDYFVCAPAA